MRKKVLVTRIIPQASLDLLKEQQVEIELYRGEKPMPYEEIKDRIRDKAGLLCLLSDRIDAEIMEAAPDLKVIANYAVGFNNIDIKEATKRKIAVTNTPEVLTETTAELALALIFATSRRICEADKYLRAGKFTGWGPMLLLGSDLKGKTLGIIGMGRIGRALAWRAQALGMQIVFYDQHPDWILEDNYIYLSLEDLLQQADIISIHVPSSKETYHLIGSEQLAKMKKDAIIINTARGEIIDEEALVQALSSGQIRAAGLDVYEHEPQIHPGLLELENVVLLPHIGSATEKTRSDMAVMAARNILAALNDRRPLQILNPEIYTK